MTVVRSIAFYVAFYLGTVFYVLGALLVTPLGAKPLRVVVDGWSHYHRWCVGWLLGIRVRIEGTLPQAPMLIAIKHESFFEAIDMPCLLDYPSVFAKAELMNLPLWGRVAATYGLVKVEREQGAKALRTMIAAAKVLTAAGRPLAIFPEGTRVPHGAEPPLQSGFAGLYKLLGLPVVAGAVDSGPLYHRRWKRRGTITYKFSEVIPPGLPREEIEERVHSAMNALN
jgi:1-acyl-sn-glycerol-3-phosphate acyltransferase